MLEDDEKKVLEELSNSLKTSTDFEVGLNLYFFKIGRKYTVDEPDAVEFLKKEVG